MLSLEVVPHRKHVIADSPSPQKLFVRVKLSTEQMEPETTEGNSVALVLTVDTSGSMRTKLPGGNTKLERAIDAIASIDRYTVTSRKTEIGLVHFDNDAHILLPLTKLDGSERDFLTTKARELLNYSGGTRLEKALTLIKAHLSESSASVKKVIILTDGETTDEDACISLAQDLSKSGIGIICIGLGSEYREDFLSVLVDQTNGFLYHLSETEDSLTGLQDALWEALILAEKEHLTRVRLDFDLNQGIKLNSFSRVYPMVQEIPSTEMGLWKVGNVGTGNEISLISELILPQHGVGSFNVGQVIATYDIPSKQLFDQTYIQPLTVTFTADKEAATLLDEDVVFLARQVRMSQLAEKAVHEAQSGQIQPAILSLQELGDLSAEVGNPVISQIVKRASLELDTNQQLAPLTIKEIKIGSKTKTLLPPPK